MSTWRDGIYAKFFFVIMQDGLDLMKYDKLDFITLPNFL